MLLTLTYMDYLVNRAIQSLSLRVRLQVERDNLLPNGRLTIEELRCTNEIVRQACHRM